jgi:hypothetical protein
MEQCPSRYRSDILPAPHVANFNPGHPPNMYSGLTTARRKTITFLIALAFSA